MSYTIDVTTTRKFLDTEAIADLLGVKRQTVRDYYYRGYLPRPDEYFGRTPVWTETTIRRWVRHRDRRGGVSGSTGSG